MALGSSSESLSSTSAAGDHHHPTTTAVVAGGESEGNQLYTKATTYATDYINRFMEGESEYEDLPTEDHRIHMAAGMAAGIVEHCSMYPFDLVKTRMMALGGQTGMASSLRSIVSTEGLRSLWRGMPVVMCWAGPAHAAYFTAYEVSKSKTGKLLGPANPIGHLMSGAVASLVHDMWMTPIDAVKQRLQKAQSQYKSGRHCCAVMFKEEGIRSFYRSYGTQICMNVPQQMVHFGCYEFLKKKLNPENEYRPTVHIISGGLAGGAAAWLTTPFDVCKTLLNTQPTLSEGQSKQAVRGLGNSLRLIYATSGFRGFFKGSIPRMLTIMPSTAICWWVYEMFKFNLHEN